MTAPDEDVVVIYTRYIVKNGKRIYRRNGGVFRLEIPRSQYQA